MRKTSLFNNMLKNFLVITVVYYLTLLQVAWAEPPKDGLYQVYYPNGQVAQVESYKNGVLDGNLISYFEDGKVQREGTYKNGVMDGPFKKYYPNGNLHIEGFSKDGELEGPYKSYNEYGECTVECTYAEHGTVHSCSYQGVAARGDYEKVTKQVEELYRKGKHLDAIQLLEMLVTSNPDQPMVYLQIGQIYYDLRKYDEALPYLIKSHRVLKALHSRFPSFSRRADFLILVCYGHIGKDKKINEEYLSRLLYYGNDFLEFDSKSMQEYENRVSDLMEKTLMEISVYDGQSPKPGNFVLASDFDKGLSNIKTMISHPEAVEEVKLPEDALSKEDKDTAKQNLIKRFGRSPG